MFKSQSPSLHQRPCCPMTSRSARATQGSYSLMGSSPGGGGGEEILRLGLESILARNTKMREALLNLMTHTPGKVARSPTNSFSRPHRYNPRACARPGSLGARTAPVVRLVCDLCPNLSIGDERVSDHYNLLPGQSPREPNEQFRTTPLCTRIER